MNTDLPGYQFVSQPSISNAGGVGFYTQENLKFTTTRSELTTSKDEFETLRIEIQNDSHHNMLCGVIYRYPRGNLDCFMDYLNSTIDRIHRENKYCIIMGDIKH